MQSQRDVIVILDFLPMPTVGSVGLDVCVAGGVGDAADEHKAMMVVRAHFDDSCIP